MVLDLYVDPLSQPARALMLFLRANKIPVNEHIISIQKGEQKTEEYAKVNKFQKITAIVHDGFHLSESVAILRYLVRSFPVADHWYPKESKAQARVDEYMAWQHTALRVPTSRYFLASLKPEVLGGTPTKAADLANYKSAMEAAMDKVETIWLADSKFIHGDQISIADVLAVGEIEMTRLISYDSGIGRPKLAAYLERVKKALEPHWSEVHAPLLQAQEFFKDKIPK